MAFTDIFDSSLLDYSEDNYQSDLEYCKNTFLDIFKSQLFDNFFEYNKNGISVYAMSMFRDIFMKYLIQEIFNKDSKTFTIEYKYCIPLNNFYHRFNAYILRDVIDYSVKEINSKFYREPQYNPGFIRDVVRKTWFDMINNEDTNNLIKNLIPKY